MLNVDAKGNLVIENVKKIEDELIVEKLIELKKAFGFLCLINMRSFFQSCKCSSGFGQQRKCGAGNLPVHSLKY